MSAQPQSRWLRWSVNEFGTEIGVHYCNACESEFSVCPAYEDQKHYDAGCATPECSTYDESRDADRLFDESPESIVRVPIVQIPDGWPPKETDA